MPREHPKHRILELLEEAIRRDIHFIARHPTTLFQCMWNTCWWYDCPETARHYMESEGARQEPPPWGRAGSKLCECLKNWRDEKARHVPGCPWLHSRRPPPTPLGVGLRGFLSGHVQGVWCVSYSPDGLRLATASVEGTIHIWDTKAGALISRLAPSPVVYPGHPPTPEPVCGLAWLRDGCRLVAVTLSGSIHVCDTHVASVLATYRSCCDTCCAALSPDERELAIGCFDGLVRVRDMQTGIEAEPFVGHTNRVQTAAYSTDGKLLFTGSLDGTVRIWQTGQRREIECISIIPNRTSDPLRRNSALGSLRGADDAVGCLTCLPRSRYVAAGCHDGTVRIFDSGSGRELRCLDSHKDNVTSLAAFPDARRLASGSLDGSIRIWNLETGSQQQEFSISNAEVLNLALSPCGTCVAAGLSDGRVALWNAESALDVPLRLRDHDGQLLCASFSPDSRRLVTGSADTTIEIWDVGGGLEWQCLRGHAGQVFFVAFSPDGRQIVSQSLPATSSLGQDFLDMSLLADSMGIISIPPGDMRRHDHPSKEVWLWDAESGNRLTRVDDTTSPPPIAETTSSSRWKAETDGNETKFRDSQRQEAAAWFSDRIDILSTDPSDLLLACSGKRHLNPAVNHLYLLRLEGA
jgi:WD40 repeat protein